MPNLKSLAVAVASVSVFAPSTFALSPGLLTHFTVTSWSNTITQVGGGSTTYLSSDPSNWFGANNPNFVSASGVPGPTNPYGYWAAEESVTNSKWDRLNLAGNGGGFSGPAANHTALEGTFEINVTATRGIRLALEEFFFTSTAAWSVRGVADAFGSGTVLTTGSTIGPGAWAIDYVSTISGQSFSYSNAHFAAVVPMPGAAALAACGLGVVARRRRR